MGGRGGRVSRHRNGGQGRGDGGCWGIALCQHVPETAATQSCPAGCQACVSCVVSSPVLHHVHCVFGSFPIHGSRRGPALPAKLWLSSVSLIRRLPWPRIGASGAHWSGRVVRVSWIRLLHVNRVSLWRITLRWVALWRCALGWVAWSSGATAGVWRGLLKIHL